MNARTNGPVTDEFKKEFHEFAMLQRELGRKEARIAAMRMFEKLKMPSQAVAVGLMEVDRYLTSDEIADRNRMP